MVRFHPAHILEKRKGIVRAVFAPPGRASLPAFGGENRPNYFKNRPQIRPNFSTGHSKAGGRRFSLRLPIRQLAERFAGAPLAGLHFVPTKYSWTKREQSRRIAQRFVRDDSFRARNISSGIDEERMWFRRSDYLFARRNASNGRRRGDCYRLSACPERDPDRIERIEVR